MSAPKHVGIIMDGNRRFSKRLVQQPWKGHAWGSKKLEEVLRWCQEKGVAELTVFALSTQNLNRPQNELDYLLDLFAQEAQKLLARTDDLKEQGLRIQFIGRKELLPKQLQELMQSLEETTQNNEDYVVNIAVAYGGREEIVDAAKQLAQEVAAGSLEPEEITEDIFAQKLYLPSEPDLIIRTGGEQRTSNFLAWQSTYAEWVFVDALWPEFSKESFTQCLEAYSARERRFGK